MPTDSRENRRPTKHQQVGALPPEPEELPCPRCDSTNTKFCYYNNYNFSQPRHFCKSCRRYWTHGGTLRDIPVGGGSRKNAKRSRTAVVNPASFSYPSARSAQPHQNMSPSTTPLFVSLADGRSSVPFVGDVKPSVNGTGSFTSLLNTQGPGFLALGGFGFGIGPEFDDVGFGLGRAVWPFPGDYIGGAAATAGAGGGGTNVIGNTWQLENGEGGFMGGDCFSLPDLAISTTGNGMK